MKLPCKIVEDMLPIYYDGVCSEESAMLIEEHLKNCTQCSRLLTDLHTEIEISEKPVDDLKPLVRIQKKWKKSKRVYLRTGICVTLAVLVLVMTVFSGIWYFSLGKYWYQLTEVMDPIDKEDHIATSSDYVAEQNGYRFDVSLPVILSNSGFVRVMDDEGLVLFFYPETGGSYSFWFYITDEDNEAYSVYLKSDMTPDFDNHPFPVRSELEKQRVTRLIIDRKEDVISILDAVQSLWGIDLLKYAP